MHFMIIIFYPHNFGYFVQTLELHNVSGCFGLELHNVFGCLGVFFALFSCSFFYFYSKEVF